ncbi:cold-shock protein [Marinomonas algicola]|uniref:cold-shock protein n=1 Tax=Marinomonas algicola TaxID=2773454 RepID=UPI001748CBD8|nr:cold shock domain-containing protein [Marinomonas algicola]
MNKKIGKVKWFNNTKGVGFIAQADAPDVFVHYKSISVDGHKMLRKGQQVFFQLVQTEFGLQAADVSLVEPIN